ncbi:hypothetical protein L1765_09300 [Microaerobacter geothermalis]|uniref:hypothetical protein n=1 Tax=Microaerobacter geothermalis TaxID=674972 RepID=UPI001F223A64|nr:hypothetical protein [Microaerobacter geothermalis]MCF6094158.1 hypothetical protein [Microaerobacter geothermalis]
MVYSYPFPFRQSQSVSIISHMHQGDIYTELLCSYWTQILVVASFQSPYISTFESALFHFTYARTGARGSLQRYIQGNQSRAIKLTLIHCLVMSQRYLTVLKETLPKVQTEASSPFSNPLKKIELLLNQIEPHLQQTISLAKNMLGEDEWEHSIP